MHSLHARLPKNFVLEERLEAARDFIEVAPTSYRGCWLEAASLIGKRPYTKLFLDLGCGKGAFSAELAKRHPEALVVGIDFEPICIAYAATLAKREGLKNLLFIPWQAERIGEIFETGEIDRLYLNFPTPFPRKKEAEKRIVHAHNLFRLAPLLAKDATLLFKTDSLPLFEYSKEQFKRAGYTLTWITDDARAERPDDPMSWYELRLSQQGATTFAIEAKVDTTAELALNANGLPNISDLPVSLVDYLPEDLESLSYIPHGMAGTVVNLINQKKNNDMGTTRRERKHAKWRKKHRL